MKRLNPETGKPFVRGETRADGFLFSGYQSSRVKQNGFFHETWLIPEKFEKRKQQCAKWQNENPEKHKAACKVYKQNNKEKISNIIRKSNIKHRNRILETQRRWKKNNPEKVKAARQRTQHKRTAYEAKRRAAKLQRTPKWLTKEHYKQIDWFFAEAKCTTQETGILHEVDHIVPLQGDHVSGLHVPWNLQILTKTQNARKSNRALNF